MQGASPAHAEEVAVALAEEVEAWLAATQHDEQDVAVAIELTRQLRLLGWLVAVDLGGDMARMMTQLEQLMAAAGELTQPPVMSGVRRKVTPHAGVPLAELYGAEDDERTVVKKSKWESAPRSANRILEKDGSDPPPSLR